MFRRLEHRELHGPGNHAVPFFYATRKSRDIINRLKQSNELDAHSGCVNALCWSSDGSRLLSGSDDTTLCIWDANAEKLECRIATGHRANIFSAKFMPYTSDTRIVSCAGDHEIRVFDVDYSQISGREFMPAQRQRILSCHAARVKRIAVEQHPALFLSCSEDGTVRQFDLRESHNCMLGCPGPLLDHGSDYDIELHGLTLNRQRPHYFAICGTSPYVYMYDRRMIHRSEHGLGSCVRRFIPSNLQRGQDHVTAVKFSATNSNELLGTWSADNVYLFDIFAECSASDETGEMSQSTFTVLPDLFDTVPAQREWSKIGEAHKQGQRLAEQLFKVADDALFKMPPLIGTDTSDESGSNHEQEDANQPEEEEEEEEVNANNFAVRSSLAMARGDYETAIDIYTRAIHNIMPPTLSHAQESDAYCGRAIAYLRRGAGMENAVSAARDAAVATSLKLSSVRAWWLRATTRWQMARQEQDMQRRQSSLTSASEYAQRALQLASPAMPAYVRLMMEQFVQDAQPPEQQPSSQREPSHEVEAESSRIASHAAPTNDNSDSSDEEKLEDDERLEEIYEEHRRKRSRPSHDRVYDDDEEQEETSAIVTPNQSSPATPRSVPMSSVEEEEAEQLPIFRVDWLQRLATMEAVFSTIPCSIEDPPIAMIIGDLDHTATAMDHTLTQSDGSGVEEEEEEAQEADDSSAAEDTDSSMADANRDSSDDSSDEDSSSSESGSTGILGARARTRSILTGEASRRHRLDVLQGCERNVPCVHEKRVYKGHMNVETVKDVNFYGPNDEFVVSGSDDGNLFIWDKETAELIQVLHGDDDVVNVVEGHPFEPTLAVSGIESTIKIFRPTAESGTESAQMAVLDEILASNDISRQRSMPITRISRRMLTSLLLRMQQGGDGDEISLPDCAVQ